MEKASANLAELKKLIGRKVRKINSKKIENGDFRLGKPFKSRSYVNTIKDVIIHPFRKEPAFTFEEDDSFVSVDLCIVLKDNKNRSRNYGLDLLDRVKYLDYFTGTVIELGQMDNNSVYVLMDSKPYEDASRVTRCVAEACEVIDVKIEVGKIYYHLAHGPVKVLEILPQNELKIEIIHTLNWMDQPIISNKNLRPYDESIRFKI